MRCRAGTRTLPIAIRGPSWGAWLPREATVDPAAAAAHRPQSILRTQRGSVIPPRPALREMIWTQLKRERIEDR